MIIYLDMDGVLADFFDGFAVANDKTHWKQIKDERKALDNLKGTDFFYTLNEFPTTSELITYVKNIAWIENTQWDWGICSSPLRNDHDNSAYWKRRWLDERGYCPDAANLVFTNNKSRYATSEIDGSANILIDDKLSNVKSWSNCGGIGLLYQANKDSLYTLFHELQRHTRKLK